MCGGICDAASVFQAAADFTGEADPDRLFRAWFDDAEHAELNDPNAMTLATVDNYGLPQCPRRAHEELRRTRFCVLHKL